MSSANSAPIWWPVFIVLFGRSLSPVLSSDASNRESICGDYDVRRAASLTRIQSCTVIEGNLLILMTKLPVTASVPNLREITGYLVIYDLTGLESLSTLFPNLTVIRGQSLIYNYALVIRSTTLKYIGLPSLRVIQRGGVRIDLNANLCYVRTVNWTEILGPQSPAAAPVRHLSNRLICPENCPAECSNGLDSSVPTGALIAIGSNSNNSNSPKSQLREDNKLASPARGHCWSPLHCQSVCSPTCTKAELACEMDNVHRCCHPQCLAGCYGPGAHMCVACKAALYRGVCVAKCPPDTLLYLRRRCVTPEECFNSLPVGYRPTAAPVSAVDRLGLMRRTEGNISLSPPAVKKFAVHRGECVSECPAGYQRDPQTGHCSSCGDDCPRTRCNRLLINTVKALSKLNRCYSVLDLYISIQEGDWDVIEEQFDMAFSSLQEVELSLKIIRATALRSLSFLRHLRRIGTAPNMSPNATVLEVRGNDNLRELWSPRSNDSGIKRGLQVVSGGLVHFILNRQLCPQRVLELRETGALILPGGRDFHSQERELAETTNGKFASCDRTELPLMLTNVLCTSVTVLWPRLFHATNAVQPTSDVALIFFQPTKKNFTAYSGRLSCFDDRWQMVFSSCNQSSVSVLPNFSVPQLSGDYYAPNVSHCAETLRHLQPATRYAIYVERKQLFSHRSEISRIIYFTTKPSNPSVPRLDRLHALNDTHITVRWRPPVHANGVLDVYLIWFRSIQFETEYYLHRDFCFTKPDWVLTSNTAGFSVALTKFTGKSWSVLRGLSPRHQPCLPSCASGSSFATASLWMANGEDLRSTLIFAGNYTQVGEGQVGLVVVPVVHRESSTDAAEGSTAVGVAGSSDSDSKPLTYILRNLRGFSEYIVELQTCQVPDPSDVACRSPPWRIFTAQTNRIILFSDAWIACTCKYCSPRVFRTQRTLKKAAADEVDSDSIYFEADRSGTVHVFWKEPPDPNGVVLYYSLRYRRLDNLPHFASNTSTDSPQNALETPNWSTLCVTRAEWQLSGSRVRSLRSVLKGRSVVERGDSSEAAASFDQDADADSAAAAGATLRRTPTFDGNNKNGSLGGAALLNLLPGPYELQIMAVSLAGNSSWTKAKVFEVEVSPELIAHERKVMLTAVFLAIFAVLSALVIACVIHWIRKKRLLASAWSSANPEYWHVYEVDDWEMQLEDIDSLGFKSILGKGNFGMVYRGVVKTLRTPAKHFYPNPVNLPAAIKTLSSSSTVFDRRDFVTEACYMKQFQTVHLVRLFGVVSKGPPSSPNPRKFKVRLSHLLTALWRFGRRPKRRCGSAIEAAGGVANTGSSASDHSLRRRLWALLHRRENAKGPPQPLSSKSAVNGNAKHISNGSGDIPAPGSGHDQESMVLGKLKHFSASDSVKLFSEYGPFVLMELMENGDLATYLRRLGDSGMGFVDPSQAYLWAVQIADGMAYLENKKYVHR
uniref:receptor protein-tyrosine kinase n=1 Tax=Schistocephalus solidus TaxID=70667 RepID=A0A0X3NPX8_SCHSO